MTIKEEEKNLQITPYQESEAVKQAQAMLQQQLNNKPGAYQSAWQTQLNDILQNIQNRKPFSYDMNADALYNQYKNQYTNQGKMAMMDTMGQAAAMTGGYGNSYAQGVGQQAYQGYLQQLNDKVPELYQLALSKYQMEGNDMKDQASLIAQMENLDYGRYRDQVSDYNTELDRLQNRYDTERDYDYGKWADNRDFGYGQYIDDRNYQYQQGRDQIADAQWQKEFDFALQQYNDSLKKTASRSSGGGGDQPIIEDGRMSEDEKTMHNYVVNMLNNATSSRFNPEQVINASDLTKEQKEIALEVLDHYISGGVMKTTGKIELIK